MFNISIETRGPGEAWGVKDSGGTVGSWTISGFRDANQQDRGPKGGGRRPGIVCDHHKDRRKAAGSRRSYGLKGIGEASGGGASRSKTSRGWTSRSQTSVCSGRTKRETSWKTGGEKETQVVASRNREAEDERQVAKRGSSIAHEDKEDLIAKCLDQSVWTESAKCNQRGKQAARWIIEASRKQLHGQISRV